MLKRPGIGGSALGIAPVLAGLGAQAATTYITLIIAGRVLGAAAYGDLSALYVLLTSISTGLFLPFEQEIARRRGRESVTGLIDRNLTRRAVQGALGLSATVVILLVGGSHISLRLLGENRQLLGALCLAIPGYACCFISRGAFAGSQQTSRYGLQLGYEGSLRLAGMLSLAAYGSHRVSDVGWLFGAAPWLALALSLLGRPTARSGPDAVAPVEIGTLARLLSLLLISSLASQLLVNAGPVVVEFFAGPQQRARAGAFLAALVIVRLPVLLLTAAQPVLLPMFAARVALREFGHLQALVAKMLVIVLVVSALSASALGLVGPTLMRKLFNFHEGISGLTFAWAGVSVGLFLASTLMAQALLGLGGHRATSIGWLIGILGLAVGIALPNDPVNRASFGFFFGAVCSALGLGKLLLRHLRVASARPLHDIDAR